MEADLSQTVSVYLAKYSKTLESKLGLTKDDLLNDIREQVWKGLLTYSSKGGASVKTYLNNLIKNRFIVLFKRSKIKKNNMVQYYGDLYASSSIDDEYLITEETGETVFLQRQIIGYEHTLLEDLDRNVYEDLIVGRTLDEMSKRHKQPRSAIKKSIDKIDNLLKSRGK